MPRTVLIAVAIVIAVLVLTGLVIRARSRGAGALAHETPPTVGGEPAFDAEALMREIKESSYYAGLQPLKGFVDGRTVVRSEVGNAGFILCLDNATWAATFRDQDKVGHAMGAGEPTEAARSAISSTEYGDASNPIQGERPYASQPCDLFAEVGKSHGQTLSGLAFGADSFNFAFADGHELDVSLVQDQDDQPAVRVFWEQW